VSRNLQRAIRLFAGLMITHTAQSSQGLFSDGWAAPLMRFMLPPSTGPVIIEGSFPEPHFATPTVIAVEANNKAIGMFVVSPGDFRLVCELPATLWNQLIHLKIRATEYIVSAPFSLRGDRRRLAYQVKSIRCAEPVPSPAAQVPGTGTASRVQAVSAL